jgi:hypothetical protein
MTRQQFRMQASFSSGVKKSLICFSSARGHDCRTHTRAHTHARSAHRFERERTSLRGSPEIWVAEALRDVEVRGRHKPQLPHPNVQRRVPLQIAAGLADAEGNKKKICLLHSLYCTMRWLRFVESMESTPAPDAREHVFSQFGLLLRKFESYQLLPERMDAHRCLARWVRKTQNSCVCVCFFFLSRT